MSGVHTQPPTDDAADGPPSPEQLALEKGSGGPQEHDDALAWPRLRHCYHILMRLGREADLNGMPDPPSDMQAFRHLAGQGQPPNTTAETERV